MELWQLLQGISEEVKKAGDRVVCKVVGGVLKAWSMQGLQASGSEEVTGNFRLFA